MSGDEFWLIKTVDKKINVKGSAYLDFVFCSKDEEINGKLWDYNENFHGVYESGDLVKVRSTRTQFNGSDQLKVEKIRHVALNDDVDISEFVPSAEYSGEAMLRMIYSILDGVKDEELKNLTKALLEDREKELLNWPAAFKLHHAMRGGLLYHTLSILRMCESISRIYLAVDKDLLFCGAIVHDLCKIDEFNLNSAGLVTSYSVKGELLGHLIMGAMKIEEKAKALSVSEDTAMLLEHMIISHHGEPEFGSSVRPMFLEAEILSQLDKLDATIFEINSATENLQKGEFSSRQWALDNRKLYCHKRKEVTTKADLL